MKSKKCLLVAPTFYNYYQDIASSLEKQGYTVEYYSDQYKFKKIDFVLNKIIKSRAVNKQNKHIKKLCKKIRHNTYDLLVVINGKLFSKQNIQSLLQSAIFKKKVYYAWDSSKNFPNIKNFLVYFDRCLSFDLLDCEGERFIHLPLFFSKTYVPRKKDIDVVAVMNLYPSKIKSFYSIYEKIPTTMSKFYFLRLKSKMQFTYFKRKDSLFKKIDTTYIKYSQLDRNQTYEIFNRAKAVIDISLEHQTGLTMRTFEALANGAKLITNNYYIKKYDFYNENNILIFDNNTTENTIIDFLKTDFVVEQDFFQNYNVDCFVRNMIGDD